MQKNSFVELILNKLNLVNQEWADIIFHNLTKLEVLKLLNCRIYTLEGSLTRDFKYLKTLYLSIKNVYNVLYRFTEPLSSLRHLVLETLQMFCSCDNNWLINWSKQFRQVEVIMYDVPLDELKCLSGDGIDTPNFVKYAEANCSTQVDFILFATTALGVLLFMLVVLPHNLVGSNLLPLYHITLGWLSEAMRSNGTGRYDYDAFVSYNFQLGKDIVENITDSLYRSRHTLCLVSRHYLRSNWCSLEMKLATARLQVEQRDILLLVFLEEIPPRLLSAHHSLARLVKTRTYLDWTQDLGQHQAFWDRLWSKLKSFNA
uniref:TIR domain-containing protein n=1 Tax=Esox lucius TaxID=8010 RepID=A0AAY5KVY5_ESOLU